MYWKPAPRLEQVRRVVETQLLVLVEMYQAMPAYHFRLLPCLLEDFLRVLDSTSLVTNSCDCYCTSVLHSEHKRTEHESTRDKSKGQRSRAVGAGGSLLVSLIKENVLVRLFVSCKETH